MSFKGPWKRVEERLSRAEPIKPGLYHYQRGDDFGADRFHLRVEEDGTGILSVNAQKIIHLNETAVEYAKLALKGASDDEAVRRITSRYKISNEQALSDFHELREKLERIERERDVCPIVHLGMERIEPFQTPIRAPYRLDFALTYRCNNNCSHCYVARPKNFPEMTEGDWKKALLKAWEIGIPHVVFTGGEATLREDLVGLVECAEDIGLISGLLTNGRNLAKGNLIGRLENAGLDHIQITIESNDYAVHDRMVGSPEAWEETVEGIRASVNSKVYTITNTTITKENRDTILLTIDFLEGLGIETVAMNGIIYTGEAKTSKLGVPENEMEEIVEGAKERAWKLGMRFIWYTPTKYCRFNPITLGLGPKQCTAAKFNMCVEPNGDVIPCQSYYEPCGNILTDEWKDIWESPTCRLLREKGFADKTCQECELFPLCGGGCPLSWESAEFICVESKSSI
ncbi:MAG: radical SAM protein [Actinomycetota bacterium]|nr:radical SAM protein [Actinomycetota bacterium]